MSAPGSQPQQVHILVTAPPRAKPGDSFRTKAGGKTFEVVVPAGVAPGGQFPVRLPVSKQRLKRAKQRGVQLACCSSSHRPPTPTTVGLAPTVAREQVKPTVEQAAEPTTRTDAEREAEAKRHKQAVSTAASGLRDAFAGAQPVAGKPESVGPMELPAEPTSRTPPAADLLQAADRAESAGPLLADDSGRGSQLVAFLRGDGSITLAADREYPEVRLTLDGVLALDHDEIEAGRNKGGAVILHCHRLDIAHGDSLRINQSCVMRRNGRCTSSAALVA